MKALIALIVLAIILVIVFSLGVLVGTLIQKNKKR